MASPRGSDVEPATEVVLDALSGAVGVGWTGDKSKCREDVKNVVVVVVGNASCLPDLAKGTPYMRSKPLSQTMRTLLPVS
jgi:hypothetical protein